MGDSGAYSCITIDEHRLLQTLLGLIEINSVNPSLVPGGNGEEDIARFIGRYLEQMGFCVKYQYFGEKRANVIGILKGYGSGPSLMLNGHVDTVSVEGMSIDPLKPVVSEGKVYGRGSFDMKGGIAAMIEAVTAVALSGARLRGDVILACVGDEEYASAGTELVAKEFKTDAAIVCEPTGLDVVVAHKGFAWIEVRVQGRAAHGSRPQDGIDAIAKAGRFLMYIDDMTPRVLSQKSHPLLGSPSIHASLVSGGTELSTYPATCSIKLERRTLPGENQETVSKEISDIIEKVKLEDPGFSASWNVFFERPPFEVSPAEPVVQLLCEAVRNQLGKEPKIAGTSPWLDSAILKEAGIPTAVFGPGGEGAHSAVEYVDFSTVIATARVLADAILRFCG